MEYTRRNDTVILRVDPGEEILSQITEVAVKEKLMLAEINGLGAVRDFTVGAFDTEKKEFYANQFEGTFEIVSLTGTITEKDSKPYLHLHMSAANPQGNVFGGHLNKAVVSATAEIVIRIIEGHVGRKMNEEIGLNLFDF